MSYILMFYYNPLNPPFRSTELTTKSKGDLVDDYFAE